MLVANGSEVACPLTSGFVPADVPLAEQSPPFAATSVGLHKKNSTLPVGVGPVPDTVTVSVADVPGFSKFPLGSESVVIVGIKDATLLANPISVPNLNSRWCSPGVNTWLISVLVSSQP